MESNQPTSPRKRFLRWCLLVCAFVAVLFFVLYVPFAISSESSRRAAVDRLGEPPSMEFYRQLASRENRSNDDTDSLPPSLEPAGSAMRIREAEVTLAGYARLFEDLEPILTEMDSSAPQVRFDILLKREELRTREEQSLVEEWDHFEENERIMVFHSLAE